MKYGKDDSLTWINNMADSFTKRTFELMLEMNLRSMSKSERKRIGRKLAARKWLYPSATERKYQRWITDLLSPMGDILESYSERFRVLLSQQKGDWANFRKDDIGEELSQLNLQLREEQEGKFVEGRQNTLAGIFVIAKDTNDFNKKQWGEFTKIALGSAFVGDEAFLFPLLDTWKENNFILIESLSQEYIKKANTTILDGFQFGRSYKDITKDLQKMDENLTKTRARLIARDQVGKLNGILTQSRQADAGIDVYQWDTSRDERVRGRPGGKFPSATPSHWAMQGKFGRWDDPTVYSDDGVNWKPKTGNMPLFHPGMDIQCRCSGLAYFDELIGIVDQKIETANELGKA